MMRPGLSELSLRCDLQVEGPAGRVGHAPGIGGGLCRRAWGGIHREAVTEIRATDVSIYPCNLRDYDLMSQPPWIIMD